MAAADPSGAFPGGAKPCRACSDFKQWAKIGPGILEITSLFKLYHQTLSYRSCDPRLGTIKATQCSTERTICSRSSGGPR